MAGGATTSTGGTGMPGSMGAVRIADTRAAMPGIVLMHGLEIVGAEKNDHQGQRRVHFNALGQALQAVPARLERIVPDGAAAIEAIFDDTHFGARSRQRVFHDAGPALIESQPVAGAGNNSPRQGVGINENLVPGSS